MDKRPDKIVLASFFLSGLAALIYQVSWLRLAGLYFEGTAYAAATVVAVFMGGLALGSYLAGKIAARWSQATNNERRTTNDGLLLLYFNIEALIAAFALAVPFLFRAARPLFGAIYRSCGGEGFLYHLGRLGISTAIMLPAAVLMGLTLPLLIDALTREQSQLSRKSGFLYGVNCLGAALGATLCGFVLLPSLGTLKTTLVGVALNLAIALLGWNALGKYPWSKGEIGRPKPEVGEDSVSDNRPSTVDLEKAKTRPFILVVFSLSGFCALNFEIIWTRILSANIGPASYGFATILACFILGLAIGSSLYAYLERRIRDKVFSCGILLLLAGLAASLATIALPRLPGLAAKLIGESRADFGQLTLSRYLLAAFFVLPLTIFTGALFPAAAASYVRDA